MNAIRWICGFTLKERKKELAQLSKLLGLESVSMVIKKGMLRWFVHVECKDYADLVK